MSKNHLKKYCDGNPKNTESRCRYLKNNSCMKLTSSKKEIDDKVNEYLKNKKSHNTSPFPSIYGIGVSSIGDNCNGYPCAKYTEVGYDIN